MAEVVKKTCKDYRNNMKRCTSVSDRYQNDDRADVTNH